MIFEYKNGFLNITKLLNSSDYNKNLGNFLGSKTLERLQSEGLIKLKTFRNGKDRGTWINEEAESYFLNWLNPRYLIETYKK